MTDEQSRLFPKPSLNVLRDLDRSEIEPLAYKILVEMEPFCVRSMIAGSIRRRKGKINDIDIVVQPKPVFNAWLDIIKFLRHDYDAITEKQGEKLAVMYVPFASKQGQGHVQVDLYRATAQTFGNPAPGPHRQQRT